MWQQLLDTEYFLNSNELEIYVTDFVKIWYIKFSKESFLACLKQSNPNLMLDDVDLVKKGLFIISNEGLKSVNVKSEASGLNVTLCRSFNYLLSIQMRLSEGSQALFFQRVTSPLLNIIQDLHESQKTLQNLLLRKDREIKEYKDEGGQLSLKHYKTDPFNKAVHMSEHNAYLESFGSSELPESLLRKQILVPETQIFEIKEEPMNVIQEPEQIKEEDIKSEPETIKIETERLKSEPTSKSQLIRPGVSPSKGKRKKLAL